MKRSLWILVAVVGAGSLGISLSSCNNVACGPGTVQMQQKDGTLKCVPVSQQEMATPCDVDAGNVVIVGGKCVSAIQCDPGTTMDINGICVGKGGGPVGCSTPSPGNSCVFGDIFNFTDGAKNAVTPIHVALYDPQVLLSMGAAIAETDLTSDGSSYAFQNFKAPQLGLIVILTSSPTGTTMSLVAAATGDQGVGAGIYHVDAYAVKAADVAGWNFDVATAGAVIGKFYNDPKPPSNLLVANEKNPVAGVVMTKDGASAGVQYFNAGLTAVDNTLTSTSTSGAAIVAAPVTGGFPTFTGMGGGITWEMLPGGSAAGLVLITRFHPSM